MTDPRRARRLRKAELALRALVEARGNIKQAAADLGVAETTVRKRVADYVEIKGLETPLYAAFVLGQEKQDEIGTRVA